MERVTNYSELHASGLQFPLRADLLVEVLELAVSTTEASGMYRADVLRSPGGGTASGAVAIDVGAIITRRHELEQAVLLGRLSLAQADPSEHQIRAIGRTLFTALFGGGRIGAVYRGAVALTTAAREDLTVVLKISDPALAALPWEAMYDDVAGEYLSQRRQLARQIDAQARRRSPSYRRCVCSASSRRRQTCPA